MLTSFAEYKQTAMLHRLDNGGGLLLLKYLKPSEHKPDISGKRPFIFEKKKHEKRCSSCITKYLCHV